MFTSRREQAPGRRKASQCWLSVFSLLSITVVPALAQDGAVDLCAGFSCGVLDDCHEPGVCDPSTGACTYAPKPDGTPCNDYHPVTYSDVCTNGVCAGAWNYCFGVECRPLDQCHDAGVCELTTGACSHPPKPDGTPCNDTNTATINDVCTGGDCSGAWDPCFAVSCPPPDDCHAWGVCDSSTGLCLNPARPDGAPCNDGSAATVMDACREGVCTGVFDLCFAVACPALDDCHEIGECDPETGECSHPQKPDGTLCDDGSAATVEDVCTDGECAGVFSQCNGVVCTAPDTCHVSRCVHATGECAVSEKADGSSCDDGDAATSDDACESGVCVGVVNDRCLGVVCEPLDGCHDAACHPESGECLDFAAPDGRPCDDGWNGTTADSCQSGVCVGVSRYNFAGFFRPVAPPPQLTESAAGASLQLKFSLGGYFGLDFVANGGPASAPLDCDSHALRGPWTPLTSDKPVTYDPETDRYKLPIKSDRAWSGTCRRVLLELDDGASYWADFVFRAAGRSKDQ